MSFGCIETTVNDLSGIKLRELAVVRQLAFGQIA
jgi:hypothetical protein